MHIHIHVAALQVPVRQADSLTGPPLVILWLALIAAALRSSTVHIKERIQMLQLYNHVSAKT